MATSEAYRGTSHYTQLESDNNPLTTKHALFRQHYPVHTTIIIIVILLKRLRSLHMSTICTHYMYKVTKNSLTLPKNVQ